MKIRNALLLISFLLFQLFTYAQGTITVRGTVMDNNDQPLPGASIIVKGTTTGTQTDFDGNYVLDNVPPNATLVFSYLGFTSLEIGLNGRTSVTVQLLEDAQALDEVVVVGYGEMKAKDLTSAISTVKTEDIVKTPSGSAMQALQGKVAGLQIVSNGAPGSSPTVRVRGIGSYNTGASNPLFVVDGAFFDNIDFLNPSDITSISVLKDASAAAIYGVRAANGVVLIETKSGGFNKKPEITYNGYQGVQVAHNVLKLSNAEQFATLARESGSAAEAQFIENAIQRYGRSRINPNVPNVNTDWYDEILRKANIQSHSLGITGGGDDVSYAFGLSYFEQEGILKMKNEYERFNLRSKINFDVSERLKVGVSALFSNATRFDAENGAFSSAYFAVPTMPVLDPDKVGAYPRPYANAQDLGYRGPQNPFPIMDGNENRNRIRNAAFSFDINYEFIPRELTFKSAYYHNFETLEARLIRLPYFFGNGNAFRPDAELIKKNETISNQTWDNTLTYTKEFGKHNLTLLAGTSFKDESFEQLEAKGLNFPNGPGIGDESYYLDLVQTIVADDVGDDGRREFGFSYFGRVAYNYDSRYLLYATFRADGTNKYQEKWGYFPTIGAGWVISDESFMEGNGIFDYLKFRGSWGKLGNDSVDASEGSITSTPVFTSFGDTKYAGIVTSSDYTALKWEVTSETNVGLSARLFNNQLSIESDYFIRDTEDAVIPVSRLLVEGETRKNTGGIRNSGFEIAMDWNKQVSENFSYNIGANFATLKNEVLNLDGQQNLTTGGDFTQRSVVGGSISAFYGLKIEGIYQTADEVAADPAAIAANAAGQVVAPGDFKFVDLDGNGVINAADRVDIGSFLPSYTFGFNMGFKYKAFDFSMNAIGQGGNVIVNLKRGAIRQTSDPNMDRDFAIHRWTGPGSTNSYPSARAIRNPWSNDFNNDFYVEKGDFVRLQNVTLGYTVPRLKGKFDPEIRFYLTAERPLTLFDYNGFNPEVADGRDNQTYPIPGVYTFGINIKI